MNYKKTTTLGASVEKADCGKQVTEPSNAKMVDNVTMADRAKGRNPKEEKPTDDSLMQIILVPLCELTPHPLVLNFYPIDPDMVAGMSEQMKERGYDSRFPVQVCVKDGKYFVWDGITRLKSSIIAGMKKIPVVVSAFASDDDLMEAVVEVQTRRRSCTVPVIMASVEKLVEIAKIKARSQQGRRNDLLTSRQICPDVETGGANAYIARLVGKSVTTVKHLREIIDNPELKRKVLAGELSLNQAHESLHPKKTATEESSPTITELHALYSGEKEEDESAQELEPEADSKHSIQLPPLAIPEGMLTQRPESSASIPAVTEKVVTESDEDAGMILVPVKFLQVTVEHIYIAYVEELISIVGGPDTVGGRIINEALKKRRAM